MRGDDEIKNKKLAILLSIFSLCYETRASEKSNILSFDHVAHSEKEEKRQSDDSNFIWKTIYLGGNVLKWILIGTGGYATLVVSDNYYNSEAKKEYLSLIDKYKDLSYNEKLDKFLKTAENLISEYDKKYEKTNKKAGKQNERTSDYNNDKNILRKSKDEMNNVPFGRLKSGKKVVCADFTHILQTLAQELGLICYNLIMLSSNGGDGHSVLMIAERKKYPDGDNRLNWFVIDGTNYQYLRELLVETFGYEKTKRYPKLRFAAMAKLYKSNIFGYDKLYVVKNNNCVYVRNLDAKNDVVAILNDNLVNRLDKGCDVDWTDDTYVKSFEQIEKNKL